MRIKSQITGQKVFILQTQFIHALWVTENESRVKLSKNMRRIQNGVWIFKIIFDSHQIDLNGFFCDAVKEFYINAFRYS